MPRVGACIGCARWDSELDQPILGFCSRYTFAGDSISTDGTWPARLWCGGPFRSAQQEINALSGQVPQFLQGVTHEEANALETTAMLRRLEAEITRHPDSPGLQANLRSLQKWYENQVAL